MSKLICNSRKVKLTACILFVAALLLGSGIMYGKEKALLLDDKALTNKDSIAIELRQLLDKDFNIWYPLCIDTVNGGYYSDFNYKWELKGPQNKMVVSQARHIWSTANATFFYGEKSKDALIKIAAHGFRYLNDVMWDKEYGGFYNLVTETGIPFKDDRKIIKEVYGNTFAIYGLAAYYKATGDTAALDLAKKTFYWMEKHSYDPEYGGYYQFITREGVPLKNGYKGVPPKDQNSSIHILECFTELYNVWPDPLLKERLNSMLVLLRDKIIKNGETLQLFFSKDFTPVSYRDSSESARKNNFEFDHISFGHNVETAYLLLEASNALGIKDNSATINVGKKMVNYALENGWDKEHGGIYDAGYIFKGETKVKIVKGSKEWWSQIEALNSFLLMYELFPNDKANYYEKFCQQWEHIKKYLIDHKYGGWYWFSKDASPDIANYVKGAIWKVDYHTSRGLINCIKRLSTLKQ
jgi:cellobiose epimerase